MVLLKESQKVLLVLSSPVDSLTEYCFKVSNGIFNPETTSPPTQSFIFTVQTSDNFLIDRTTSDVFAQPYLSAGEFLFVSATSQGDTVGADASISIEV